MDGQRALKMLVFQQSRIVEILASANPLLKVESAENKTTLAGLRWRLLRLLREYQLFKHHEIFDPVAASGSHSQTATAKAMKERCVTVGARYVAHVERWNDGAAAASWDAYAPEALEMIDQITLHLKREHSEAAVLLGTIGRTRSATAKPPTRQTLRDQA